MREKSTIDLEVVVPIPLNCAIGPITEALSQLLTKVPKTKAMINLKVSNEKGVFMMSLCSILLQLKKLFSG